MATPLQVQSLYLSYFGRPADPNGLDYWVTQNATSTQKEVSDAFAATPEYKASIAGKSNTQIVTDYYQRLFNRAPEAAGLAYWVENLNSGALTTQNVGLALVTAAQSQTGTPDKIAVSSKITAADLFTLTVRNTPGGTAAYPPNLAPGIPYLAPVKDLPTIPTQAQTQTVVNLVIATAGGGNTIPLTQFQDVITSVSGVTIIGGTSTPVPFRFTAQNDTVNAAANQVNSNAAATSDSLTDPSTTDTDSWNIAQGNAAGFAPGTFVRSTNIENLNFSFLNQPAAIFRVDQVATGAKKISTSGTLTGQLFFPNFAASGATTFDASLLTSPVPGVTVDSFLALAVTNPSVTLIGGAGGDGLFGGDNNDTITGNAGADSLLGRGGADRLDSGASNGVPLAEFVRGDAGSDTLVYNNLGLGYVGADADFIIGFTQGPIAAGGDVLELASAAFVGLTPGQISVFSPRAAAVNQNTTVLVDTGAQIAAATGVNALPNVHLAFVTVAGGPYAAGAWLYDADGNWATGALEFGRSNNPAAITAAGLNSANISVV